MKSWCPAASNPLCHISQKVQKRVLMFCLLFCAAQMPQMTQSYEICIVPCWESKITEFTMHVWQLRLFSILRFKIHSHRYRCSVCSFLQLKYTNWLDDMKFALFCIGRPKYDASMDNVWQLRLFSILLSLQKRQDDEMMFCFSVSAAQKPQNVLNMFSPKPQ